jgi:hypothetical protein
MKNFIGRNRGNDDLERRLRRDRPEPRPEFLAMLSDRIGDRPRQRRRVGARLALVGAVSAVMLIAMSAVGGLSYAATAVQSVASVAKAVIVAPASKVVVPAAKSDNKQSGDSGNAGNQSSHKDDKGDKGDDKEYGHKEKMCHKKNTIDVDSNAVPAHLAQGDTRGECPKPSSKKSND